MKVAIDTGPLNSGHAIRGVGAYTRSLIEALQKETKKKFITIEPLDFRTANLEKCDILHYPYFSLFQKTLKLINGKKVVVTVHDVIPLLYPKNYPPGIKGKINLLSQIKTLKKVDAIITDTETSKKDIIRFLQVKPEKIHVVYLAPRKIFRKIKDRNYLNSVKKKYNLPENFVLYVGDVNYNKNIPNLIKACQIAKLPLVICGKQAADIDSLALEMKSINGPRDFVRFLTGKSHPEIAHYKNILNVLNKDVLRLGFVPDEDLVAIYNLAKLYCQPAFYEGFGFPVLESLSCGTPVAASKTQALVEVAEGAAVFFDPNNPNDIARSFKHLVKIPKLPRIYSWEKCAKDTIKVYETL